MSVQKDKIEQLLGKVSKVDAPPFLFTRIKAKIENKFANKITPKWLWASSLGLILLIMINLSLIKNYTADQSQKENLAEKLNILPNNTLYYE